MTTSDFRKEIKTEEWGGWRTSWYTRRVTLKTVCHNIRQALDEEYDEQLEDDLMGYKRVTIRNYLKHLDSVWYKMDTKMVTTQK